MLLPAALLDAISEAKYKGLQPTPEAEAFDFYLQSFASGLFEKGCNCLYLAAENVKEEDNQEKNAIRRGLRLCLSGASGAKEGK